ncbi:MAG: dephospho-CoA kinase [Ruthenibacterium sp.]
MKKIQTVAVTGRSGSGKSTVSAYFASQGFPVLDADVIARTVTEKASPCLAKLVEVFGADILDENGCLLRQELAMCAFQDAENAKKLTDITHPAIIKKLLAGIDAAEKSGQTLVFVDGAVIVGAEFERYCDKIILVTAKERDAISRIVLRDHVSKQAAHDRLSVQMCEEDLRKAADFVLENTTTEAELLHRADIILKQLQKETQTHET